MNLTCLVVNSTWACLLKTISDCCSFFSGKFSAERTTPKPSAIPGRDMSLVTSHDFSKSGENLLSHDSILFWDEEIMANTYGKNFALSNNTKFCLLRNEWLSFCVSPITDCYAGDV